MGSQMLGWMAKYGTGSTYNLKLNPEVSVNDKTEK